MKLRILVWLGMLFVGVGSVSAQQLTGSWQGVLHGRRDFRLVFQIVDDGSTPSATLYIVDQSAAGIPVSSFALKGRAVTANMPGIGVTFRGVLNTDGSAISGSWVQQSGDSLPLELRHVNGEEVWKIPAAGVALGNKGVSSSFEVATIKPTPDNVDEAEYRLDGKIFSIINYSLRDLIAFAYDVHKEQISGGPAWVTSKKFDIQAQAESDQPPSTTQLKKMTQRLLQNRFALVLKPAKKEMSVYALSVAKSGPKLTPDNTDTSGSMGMSLRGAGNISIHNATMDEFAKEVLQGLILDRPVINDTGLVGRFDFAFTWTPDASQYGGRAINMTVASDHDEAPPDLPTALRNQLGLILTNTRADADVLVIDHVQEPSPN